MTLLPLPLWIVSLDIGLTTHVSDSLLRWLSCLHCLHCRLTAKRSWVRFPHGVLLALGGRFSPECTELRWAISRAFLCGVCMYNSPLTRTKLSLPGSSGYSCRIYLAMCSYAKLSKV